MKARTVVVSGCFDPLHLGHLIHLKAARQLGDRLIVLVDADSYTLKKKGYVFMPIEDRAKILKELRCVDVVIALDDKTVAETILEIKPDIFANGGDVTSLDNIPEAELEACERVGCEVVFGVGGQKIRSSSQLVKKALSDQV